MSAPPGISRTVERERLRSSSGALATLSTGGFLLKGAFAAFW